MKTLKEVLSMVNADEGNEFDTLSELMKPGTHTEDELGALYTESIGYNPIDYHNKKYLECRVDEIATDPTTPNEHSEYLLENSECIIEDALDRFNSNKEEYLEDALNDTIADQCTWSPNGDDDSEDDEEE